MADPVKSRYPPACLVVNQRPEAAAKSSRRVQPFWYGICYRWGVVWSNVCVSGVVILYPNDRLSGFVMATKTCRAAKLYQRPLNSMRSLSVLE